MPQTIFIKDYNTEVEIPDGADMAQVQAALKRQFPAKATPQTTKSMPGAGFVQAAIPTVRKAAGPVIGAGMALASPKMSRPTLEIGGAIAGGAAGAAMGGPAAPVTAFAGEAAGYAAGKQAADLLEARRDGKPYNPQEQIKKIPGDIGEGALFAAVGNALGIVGGKAAGAFGRKLYPAVDQALTRIIDTGIAKGIRPSVAGKKTSSQVGEYAQKARDAVRTIFANKDNLRLTDEFGEQTAKLPQSLVQFGQAIEQTKRAIFKQYDEMSKAAGKYGPTINMERIAGKLDEVLTSKPLNDFSPDLVNFARTRADQLRKAGMYTTEQAQDVIQHFNSSLEAFYKNPTMETAGRARIDALVVNNMRKELDDVIEMSRSADADFGKPAGKGYQELKRLYGALKAIEKDVNHRAVVDARKNIKGLIDFSDIFSGSEVVRGVLTMNPAAIATGAAAKGISAWYKYLNNPNTAIKGMFEAVERLSNRGSGEAAKAAIRTGSQSIEKGAAYKSAKILRPSVDRGIELLDPSLPAAAAETPLPKKEPSAFYKGISAYTDNRLGEAIRHWQKALKDQPGRYKEIVGYINRAKEMQKAARDQYGLKL